METSHKNGQNDQNSHEAKNPAPLRGQKKVIRMEDMIQKNASLPPHASVAKISRAAPPVSAVAEEAREETRMAERTIRAKSSADNAGTAGFLAKVGEREKQEEEKQDARINASPLFERMKERQSARGNFSEEIPARGKRRGFRRGASFLLVIFAGMFLYGSVFSRATVAVTPKRSSVTLNETPILLQAEGKDFQTVQTTAESYRDLAASGEKYTEKKASGKITIENNFDENTQRLVKNTRFAAPDGKIYRINESVTVPGKKSDGSPGTLEAVVYADLPGAEYNIPAGTVFTIPGFKGTPRYEKFSAKSTTGISGGFQGKMKIVAPEDIAKAKQDIETELREKLWRNLLADKPANIAAWKDAARFDFVYTDPASVEGGEKGAVRVTGTGTLLAAAVDTHTFSHLLAAPSLGVSPEESVLAENIDALSVRLKDPNALGENSVSLKKEKEEKEKMQESRQMELLVTGTANIVWDIDTEKLAAALAGTKKKEYSAIFGSFPSIERARVSFSPFWQTAFPDDAKKIRIERVAVSSAGEAGGI